MRKLSANMELPYVERSENGDCTWNCESAIYNLVLLVYINMIGTDIILLHDPFWIPLWFPLYFKDISLMLFAFLIWRHYHHLFHSSLSFSFLPSWLPQVFHCNESLVKQNIWVVILWGNVCLTLHLHPITFRPRSGRDVSSSAFCSCDYLFSFTLLLM